MFVSCDYSRKKKYGSLGWNILYDFSYSDYETSREIVLTFLQETSNKNNISWDSIHFLIGTITYGGKVTDMNDQRLLVSTMKRFIVSMISNDKYKFCQNEIYKYPKLLDG